MMEHTDVLQMDSFLNAVGILKMMKLVVDMRIIQGEFVFHQLPS